MISKAIWDIICLRHILIPQNVRITTLNILVAKKLPLSVKQNATQY